MWKTMVLITMGSLLFAGLAAVVDGGEKAGASAGNVKSRTLNVLDYGAVGDDKTDNTKAFSACMKAVIAAGGGVVALITHVAKATTRLAVNTSPEPASNVVVSVAEDAAIVGVVITAIFNPWIAAGIAVVLFIAGAGVAIAVAGTARAALRKRRQRKTQPTNPSPLPISSGPESGSDE